MNVANASKNKGDRFERAALRHVLTHYAHLVDVDEEKRGRNRAGKKQDPGDLHLFTDCAIQVKAYGQGVTGAVKALRVAAEGGRDQAAVGGLEHHLGLVPVIGTPGTSVNWLAVACDWPAEIADSAHIVTGAPANAVAHVRDDRRGIPRDRRVAKIVRAGLSDIWVSTCDAWMAAYETTRPQVVVGDDGQRRFTLDELAKLLA